MATTVKKILNHFLYDKYLLNTFQMNIVFDKLIYFEYDAQANRFEGKNYS